MRFWSICVSLLLLLNACNKPSPDTLVVGTIAGPETTLMKVAQQVAKDRYSLDIKIVEFSDYNLPNEALHDGSLDANVYQHQPYLEASKKAHGYDLRIIGKTFVFPTGIYSNRIQSIDALPKRATIALPNDPSNEARALRLLQTAGIITLNQKVLLPSVQDIVKNPKQLRFKTLDAAQLPRVLADVDAAVINTTFAIPAGLNPKKDAIFIESKSSPYANLIVAKQNSPKEEKLKLLIQALHSSEVKDKAKDLFGNAAIPAW